jgi:Arc/MetJ-type ribon-helix-helix transcriptional regulator
MASDISRENEDYIEQEVASGRFRNRAEALDAGIALLRQQKALTDRLANSRRQLDSGECVQLDSAGLRQLFDDLKDRARQHATGAHGD